MKKKPLWMQDRKCVVCGATYTPRTANQKGCTLECRKQLSSSAQWRANKRQKEQENEKKKKKPAPLVTDEEQRAINEVVNARYHSPCKSRVLHPGDPEFETIARLYQ